MEALRLRARGGGGPPGRESLGIGPARLSTVLERARPKEPAPSRWICRASRASATAWPSPIPRPMMETEARRPRPRARNRRASM